MIVCGVDTGVAYHARAWCSTEIGLFEAVFVPNVEPIPVDTESRLVIERAHARPRDGRTKLKEVDNLNLAAGRLGALHPSPQFVLASEWKGEVPKKIDHERTLALLTPEERAFLPRTKRELLHVLDAIGIALWAAGRKRP